MHTHYDVLGVKPDASAAEIKAAYRAAARVVHPDASGGGPSSMFLVVQDAYEVLSDPGRRRAYDAELAAADPEHAAGPEWEPEPEQTRHYPPHYQHTASGSSTTAAAAEEDRPAGRPLVRSWETVAVLVAVLVGTALKTTPLFGWVFHPAAGQPLLAAGTWTGQAPGPHSLHAWARDLVIPVLPVVLAGSWLAHARQGLVAARPRWFEWAAGWAAVAFVAFGFQALFGGWFTLIWVLVVGYLVWLVAGAVIGRYWPPAPESAPDTEPDTASEAGA